MTKWDVAFLNALLRSDFEVFLDRCLKTLNPGHPFLPNWHIKAIAYQLERIRRGEINPFELKTLTTANAHDYAATVINLLGTMKPSDPQRRAGLQRIKRWVDKALAGEIDTAAVDGVEAAMLA